MASDVSVGNSALQKLGAERITSLTQDSVNAREVNACLVELRDGELRAHLWAFARARAVLSPDTAVPAFYYTRQYTLPTDCLRLILPASARLDWQLEGGKILTNEGGPTGAQLNIRYIKRITDPNQMDPLFREMWACKMAMQMCEAITQSTSKLENIKAQYAEARRVAKQTNAFTEPASVEEAFIDPWITSRL